MNKNYLAIGVVAVVVVGAIYYFRQGYTRPLSSDDVRIPAVEVSPTQSITQATTSGTVVAKASIDYTDSGFSPKSVTVKVGDTVKWINKSGKSMWVASAPHPMHTDFPGFDELSSAEKDGTYLFTFTKSGNWKYHNHMSPKDMGVVVVE